MRPQANRCRQGRCAASAMWRPHRRSSPRCTPRLAPSCPPRRSTSRARTTRTPQGPRCRCAAGTSRRGTGAVPTSLAGSTHPAGIRRRTTPRSGCSALPTLPPARDKTRGPQWGCPHCKSSPRRRVLPAMQDRERRTAALEGRPHSPPMRRRVSCCHNALEDTAGGQQCPRGRSTPLGSPPASRSRRGRTSQACTASRHPHPCHQRRG